MATTPTNAFPYLVGTDAPNLPTNNKLLAEGVEAILAQRIQHGEANVVGTGASEADVTVTFDTPFAVIPEVFTNYTTTTGANTKYYSVVVSVTTTAVELRVVKDNGEATFDDLQRINWLAIGV